MNKIISISHAETGQLLAEGPQGWGMMPFEGNYYISRKFLKTKGFKLSYVPGLCPYKFLYVWLNFERSDGKKDKFLGWKYFLPNPIFPFIWFRVAVPQQHPLISIQKFPQ